MNMDNLDFKKHPLYRVYTTDTAISSLFDFYRNNFVKLFAMSLIMAAILQYAATFIDVVSLQNETDINVLMEKMRELMVPVGIIALTNMFFFVIIQHYILFNPLDENNSILNSLISSFRYLVPYLVIIILLFIFGIMAVTLGAVAFVIGAIFAVFYVMTLYLFILPIMMIEGTDISHTIIRTFKLAHKNFWTNYFLVFLFMMLFIMIAFIISGLMLAPFAGNFLSSIFNPEEAANFAEISKMPLYIVLSIIANAITMPLLPIFSTILYLNSIAKEQGEVQSYNTANEEKKVTVEDLYAKPYSDNYSERRQEYD
jgi:hypothetical protein